MNEPSRRGRGALRVERRPRPRSNAPSRRHLDVTDAAAALKARGGAPLRANDDLDAPGPPRVRRGPGAQRQRFVYGRPDDGEAAARRQQGLGGRAEAPQGVAVEALRCRAQRGCQGGRRRRRATADCPAAASRRGAEGEVGGRDGERAAGQARPRARRTRDGARQFCTRAFFRPLAAALDRVHALELVERCHHARAARRGPRGRARRAQPARRARPPGADAAERPPQGDAGGGRGARRRDRLAHRRRRAAAARREPAGQCEREQQGVARGACPAFHGLPRRTPDEGARRRDPRVGGGATRDRLERRGRRHAKRRTTLCAAVGISAHAPE